ncbi:MAG: T9SS type A sorting domain-containing protein [Bacteroidetes bacterium]|nr:T9SS type A sorting domain-containing protein [Bacteroidota bacterium]
MRIILFFLFISTTSFAQNFQAHYGTAHDEDAYSMCVTPGNGFLLCGSSYGTGSGGKDAMLLKTNAGGLLEWSKVYGGAGDETAIYVQPVPAGGYIFCGETFSADVNGDAFIARTDSSGNLLWWKNYGGANYDIAYSVKPLSDGGFIVAGLTEKGSLDYDAFLMRTDANGDSLWTRIMGGPNIDHAVQVIATADSGFIFSGKILSYGSGSSDIWLVKTNANGDTTWTEEIGGPGWDEGMDILEIPNGYIICGGTNSYGSGNYDFLLMQIDAAGQLQWAKTYGGQNVEASYNVKKISSGGYAFCGYTETFGPGHSRGTDSANALLIRTDVNGDTLWSMAYGGSLKEECFAVNTTYDGGFALCGYTGSFGDSLQAYVFRSDSMGYSGCNERRASPDIGIPPLVEMHHSVTVSRGLMKTIPVSSAANFAAQQNVLCGGPLNVNENAQENISLFPNPSGDEITIRLNGERADEILITNISGRNAACYRNLSEGDVNLDVHDLSPGSYIITVFSSNMKSSRQMMFIRY